MKQSGIAVLVGPRGTGKTQLAAQCIKDSIYAMFANAKHSTDVKDGTVKYLKAREVGMVIRDSFSSKDRDEQGTWLVFSRPDLLVIDEYHEKLGTDFEGKNLTHILDARYDAMKPTILIANTKVENLPALLGPSVLDRVKEGGGVVVMDWPSFRGA